MAPQTDIPVSASILGTIGTVCWCVQLLPQIWTNWRTKQTEGLPAAMMFLWVMCAFPFGVYNCVQNFNIPLQIQPQFLAGLSLIAWSQILIYNNNWRTWTATLLALAVAAVGAGVEVLLIFTLRPVYAKGISWPIELVGIVASVILAMSLLPPYWEMWKRNGRVLGINFLFILIDWSGALFSLLALVVQHSFDLLGGILYIIVIALEFGYFVAQAIFLLRTRKLRARAKAQGLDFDDMPEARKFQWHAEKADSFVTAATEERATQPATATDLTVYELQMDSGKMEKTLA